MPVALFAFGLVICVDIHWMRFSGAQVIGWPLVWGLVDAALPRARPRHLAPPRVGIGFVLSLVCVGLTVVAVAYLGRNATGRRWVGLLAAALLDVLAAARRD